MDSWVGHCPCVNREIDQMSRSFTSIQTSHTHRHGMWLSCFWEGIGHKVQQAKSIVQTWRLSPACLLCWLRPAVLHSCAALLGAMQRLLRRLSRVCTWAARPCQAVFWPLVMCRPSSTLSPLVLACRPTSRWPWRRLMARSPLSALRVCTSWIRQRKKAWSCPTRAEPALAPAAPAKC